LKKKQDGTPEGKRKVKRKKQTAFAICFFRERFCRIAFVPAGLPALSDIVAYERGKGADETEQRHQRKDTEIDRYR